MKVNEQFDWEYTFTVDAENWESHVFETLDEARDFAVGILGANEENPKFASYARRMVVVSTSDFYDRSMTGGSVRIAPTFLRIAED